MKKNSLVFCLVLILLAAVAVPLHSVSAAPGIPGSAEFGYGAWIYLQGNQFDQALAAAVDLDLDWIGVNLDWSQWMPEAATSPATAQLDQIFKTAGENGAAVAVSFTNPPAWAMTSNGPSADLTAQVLQWLVDRYGKTLQSIELFPRANTIAGWGSRPDPVAYAALFTNVKAKLNSTYPELVFIAAGLDTTPQVTTADAWTDVDFLRSLYTNGARDWMSILSVQFTALTGDPLQASNANTGSTLRHYEVIRQIMVEYQHTNGILWITSINIPDGTINVTDSIYSEPQKQAEWLQQALIQIRSQLYMGVAFMQSLNSSANSAQLANQNVLVQNGSKFHPFYSVLKTFIQQSKSGEGIVQAGLLKTNSSLKSQNTP